MVTLPIAKSSDEERRAASQSDGLFYLRQRRPSRLCCVAPAGCGEIVDPCRVSHVDCHRISAGWRTLVLAAIFVIL